MRFSLTCAIVVSLLIPPGTLSGADAEAKSSAAAVPPALKDVELRVGGVLNGQLVDAAGNPVAATLSIISGDAENKITTNRNGRFSVGPMKGGLCVIKVGDASYACRLWHNGTAPPNAIDSIAVVQEGNVARGQHNCPPRKRLHRLTSEQCGALFLAGLTGTALALALTQDAS